ncbi:hypothetical protein, partial [Enterobacter cloacae complex sp. 2DZ2F20B]|uniref:hypothetical protein n=1 Tax=Enterobacter cloacae complex sp. 2DZ2F20B TaxID=2511993 RepID=UPI001CA59FE5
TFVRPKLEYASVVWSPNYNIHIRSIEKVQRRFVKSALFLMDGVYPPRGYPEDLLLKRINLPFLSCRRSYFSVIFLFKLIHYLIDSPELLNNINFAVPAFNKRLHNVFFISKFKTNIVSNSSIHQMITTKY